jgi:cardiolipin synthase
MRLLTGRSRHLLHRVRRVTVRVAAVALGTQLTAAAGLMTADAIRKRRSVQDQDAPADPPLDTTVHDGSMRTYTYGQDLYDDMIAAID